MFELQNASSEQQKLADFFAARHERDFTDLDLSIEVQRSSAMTAETFEIRASKTGSKVQAQLAVTDLKSFRWALNSLRQWLRHGAATALDSRQTPDFRWRGVVEGFYGKPWQHEQRLRGIDAFGDYGMNLYLIAPKDSPWQRLQWRDPLTADVVGQLSELIQRGILNGVDVTACVSPGLSVSYASDADVLAVVDRFMQMARVGATHFGLLLDDIPDTLTVPADIDRYANIAIAHADFANRVRAGLVAVMPQAHVILCPMHYCGRGDEPYLQVMGAELHPQIELMWTGRDICSGYLDIADAVIFDRTTRRPPFYWDNYPVNDGTMARRLHIGPLEGRQAGLHKYSAGLLANPMEFFEAGLLPLATVGAYLWDTNGYRPYEVWEDALTDLVRSDRDHTALRNLYRNTLGLTASWSPDFNRFLGECANAWRAGEAQAAAQLCRDLAGRIEGDCLVLDAEDFELPRLRTEIDDWVRKYRQGADWANRIAEVLSMCKPSGQGMLAAPASAQAQLASVRVELNQIWQQMFADNFDALLRDLENEIVFAG